MRRVLSAFVICLALSGCASLNPVGTWNYSVTGTPNGDYSGDLDIGKPAKDYTATLIVQGASVPFRKFSFDKKTGKASGDFDFQGTPIYFDAQLKGDELAGTMATDDMKFPFKASRKK